jgi:hypothetical protein
MDVYAETGQQSRFVARVSARSPVEEGAPVDMHVAMDRVHYFEPVEDGANLTLT